MSFGHLVPQRMGSTWFSNPNIMVWEGPLSCDSSRFALPSPSPFLSDYLWSAPQDPGDGTCTVTILYSLTWSFSWFVLVDLHEEWWWWSQRDVTSLKALCTSICNALPGFLPFSLFPSSETTTKSIPLSYRGHSTLIRASQFLSFQHTQGLTRHFFCTNTALSLKGILHYIGKTDFEKSC